MVLRLSERNPRSYLIRTSRLFGPATAGVHGKKTFVDVVLEAADSGASLAFIDGEEIASPTYVKDLAAAVRELVTTSPPPGIYHRTNDGAASWYEFAAAVLEGSGRYAVGRDGPGMRRVELERISSADLPRPARRPRYSVLQSTKLPPLRPWREALREYLAVSHNAKGKGQK
jgi:dTDP-4-dehydrorhamnose reductase